MKDKNEKKISSFNAVVGSIPSVVGLVAMPYSSQIKGSVNLQLIAFNYAFEPLLPDMWMIIRITVSLIFFAAFWKRGDALLKMTIPTSNGFQQSFKNIAVILLMLLSLCLQLLFAVLLMLPFAIYNFPFSVGFIN